MMVMGGKDGLKGNGAGATQLASSITSGNCRL